jgi:cysteine desulfurase
LLGCDAASVVFTSGGTESDNAAVFGTMGWPPSGHLVISTIEHPAVLEPAIALHAIGLEVTQVAVDGAGLVGAVDVARALRDDTRLVSIMAANNELGSIQPILEIAERVRAGDAVFHTDAVQAAPWLDLHPLVDAVDLLSISSHKLGGPMGAGALYVRPGIKLSPILRGGGQEGGRRGGTENTAAIVGLGAAAVRALARRDNEAARVARLRDRLEASLLTAIDNARPNGSPDSRLPNTCHLAFAGCDGHALVARLDLDGVSASAGSACASGVGHVSGVTEAIGLPLAFATGTLRLSLGYDTTEADIDAALSVIPTAVESVRGAGLGVSA